MTIDNYLYKPFLVEGRKFYIDKVEDHVSGASGYILCDKYGSHCANIESLLENGFKWFSFFIGQRVDGTILYTDIEKNLYIS